LEKRNGGVDPPWSIETSLLNDVREKRKFSPKTISRPRKKVIWGGTQGAPRGTMSPESERDGGNALLTWGEEVRENLRLVGVGRGGGGARGLEGKTRDRTKGVSRLRCATLGDLSHPTKMPKERYMERN